VLLLGSCYPAEPTFLLEAEDGTLCDPTSCTDSPTYLWLCHQDFTCSRPPGAIAAECEQDGETFGRAVHPCWHTGLGDDGSSLMLCDGCCCEDEHFLDGKSETPFCTVLLPERRCVPLLCGEARPPQGWECRDGHLYLEGK